MSHRSDGNVDGVEHSRPEEQPRATGVRQEVRADDDVNGGESKERGKHTHMQ